MAIPGYRWVRGLVPAEVYEHASRQKAGRTWDDHLAAVLRAATTATANTDSTSGTTDADTSPTPPTLAPVDVPAAFPRNDSTGSTEAERPLDLWRTADEVLRDHGSPDCQHGVLIGVGADLRGTAHVTGRGE